MYSGGLERESGGGEGGILESEKKKEKEKEKERAKRKKIILTATLTNFLSVCVGSLQKGISATGLSGFKAMGLINPDECYLP